MKIFGKYTSSDIDSRKTVLSLLKLAVFSSGRPIQEIHFEGEIGPSYVTASNDQVHKLAQQFLGVEDTKGPRGELKPKGKNKKKKVKEPSTLSLESARLTPAANRRCRLWPAGSSARLLPDQAHARGRSFAGPPAVY